MSKHIGLTGDPTAQDAVGLQLTALGTARGVALRLFIGVKTPKEAYLIHHTGGEIWHCGPYAIERALVGRVDRVLPATTLEEIAPQVLASLTEMLSKTPINGEAHVPV